MVESTIVNSVHKKISSCWKVWRNTFKEIKTDQNNELRARSHFEVQLVSKSFYFLMTFTQRKLIEKFEKVKALDFY